MRYIPPFGSSDPNAPWVNGDPTVGRQGSIPPAAAFENPQREIVNVISKSNITPADSDLMQMLKGIRSSWMYYAEDTGSENTISVAYDPPLSAYNRGLKLHVHVRHTNTSAVRINAGAGFAPVRKMNGSDLREGELNAGAMCTLVYDGTVFQLTNSGLAGGGLGDIFQVKIPYAVDNSPTVNVVRAWFSPPIDEIAAGDVVAVKFANTNTGPIVLNIDNLPGAYMMPNGGGGAHALQGDIKAGDVMILFFDGQYWWFQPNPEINAPIQYNIGAGQHWPSIAAANEALRRKTIGANGYVYLYMVPGAGPNAGRYPPIYWNHPSSDRVMILGGMFGPNPGWNEFALSGNSAGVRAQDAIYNINLLRTRFGTEVVVPYMGGAGVRNAGPGKLNVVNLLVTGTRPPTILPSWAEEGIHVDHGEAMACTNVACWGHHVEFFVTGGGLSASSCHGLNATDRNWLAMGGTMSCWNCSGHSSVFGWWINDAGTCYGNGNVSYMNEHAGVLSSQGSSVQWWWFISLGSGFVDLYANMGSTLGAVSGQGGPMSVFGPTSPPLGVVGNGNSIVFHAV